ncbi:MAG TPA: hypothetical protein VLE53_03635 [Gemmatimonadaceae bacterium]|nr:hypothetical protein [Gemmatimonadaceae bacterium]
MKHRLTSLMHPTPSLLLLITAASVSAQSTELPPARAVVDRYVEAIGGRAALLARPGAYSFGRLEITGQNVTGTVEMTSAPPNRLLSRVMIAAIGEIRSGYDGAIGWSLHPALGPQLMDSAGVSVMRRLAEFHAELHDSTFVTRLETVERTTFEGRQCYRVHVTFAAGGEHEEFFDVETGLLAGSEETRNTPVGTITVRTVLSDYRVFGNLLVATRLRQRPARGPEQVIVTDSIRFAPVPAETFTPPPAILALIRSP